MRRAVHKQENRNIPPPLAGGRTRNKPLSRNYYGIVAIIVIPIVIVLVLLTGLQTFPAWITAQRQQPQQTNSVMDESKGNIRKSNKQLPPPQKTYDNAAISDINSASYHLGAQQEALVLTTDYGKIRIVLQPDLSPGSVDYIHKLVDSGVCSRCNFYRAEKPGILQGVMANPSIPVNQVKGGCPDGLEHAVKNDCPEWDQNCGCHGPIMTQGAVGWAGGQAGGPDFFIDHYREPAKFWGTQHTNFGRVQDDDSIAVIRRIFELPVKKQGSMSMIETPIHFDLNIEPVGVQIATD